jgi:hypothetical protein
LVTYSDIVLQDETEKVGGAIIYRIVNRESGKYYASIETRGRRKKPARVIMVGTCEIAPFSGFPDRKF